MGTEETVFAVTEGVGAEGARFEFRAGARIGRYSILEELGRGGMGVVYSAYDPELDRKVAFKVLGHDGPDRDREQARLLREAQAMARVSHPNVIAVHDVGTIAGRVYVAMEYLDGCDLADWQSESHDWPTVLAAYTQAGRGLAAAHRVGLIHRDFKPENAFMDVEGRVRVLDFGLARAGDDGGGAVASATDSLPRPSTEGTTASGDRSTTTATGSDARVTISSRVTQHGAIIGTPAYMSPEQFAGSATDARSDQFNFCAALHEAIYGVLPFGGDQPQIILLQIMEGNVRSPPADSRAPAWLRAAIVRGLSADPDARFSSMDALLTELERDRSRPRRIAAVTAVVAAAGLGGWFIANAGSGAEAAPSCTGSEVQLAEVWSEPRREALRAAFSGKTPFADDAAGRTVAALDEYASAWVTMHRDNCEATTVRHNQTSQMMDRRLGCLDRRRKALDALASVLTAADAKVVEHAVQAAMELPAVETCGNTEALLAAIPPPEDPETARAVDAIHDTLVRVQASLSAGKIEDARTRSVGLPTLAAATDYAPVVAEVTYNAARIEEAAGSYDDATRLGTEAAWLAIEVGDDRLARQATGLLATLTGFRAADKERGRLWGAHTMALAERVGDAYHRSAALLALGNVEFGAGEMAEARDHYERALAIRRQQHGERHLAVAQAQNLLGNTFVELGDNEAAREHYEQAVASFEALFGPNHPATASAVNNWGISLERLERWDDAARTHERGLATKRKLLGEDHPSVGGSLGNLGNVYLHLNRLEDARTAYADARSIFVERLGEDHPFVGLCWRGTGEVELAGKNWDASELAFRNALTLFDGPRGSDNEGKPRARTEFGLARVLIESGRDVATGNALLKTALSRLDEDDPAGKELRAEIAAYDPVGGDG